MTRRLFDSDVYLKTCQATIVERTENALVFNQTIFFPVGGGQSADAGTIDGIKVLDVKEKNGLIYHYVESMPKGKDVTLIINWDKRLDDMQQHCGEHILSGIIKDKYNGNNKGFHIGKDFITIDIDIKIDKDMCDHIEDLANDVIYKNIELKFEYADDDLTLDFPVRKDVTVDENIRIVTIPNVDCVACCGTHPHRTGEVGLIKLYKVEKNKGLSRIFFKCGKRALLDLRKKTDIVKTLNHEFSSDDATLLERFYADKEKNEQLKKNYIELNRKQIDVSIVDQLIEGKIFQTLVFDHLSGTDMNYVIKKVSEKINAVLLVYSKSANKVMLSHDGSFEIKCNELFKTIKSYGGKGGGSQKVAQGMFTDEATAMKFVEYLIEVIDV